jgi:hypothetical protein
VRLHARFGDWCGQTRHDIRSCLAVRYRLHQQPGQRLHIATMTVLLRK